MLVGGKGYNFLWLDNKLQQLLEPSHGGSTDPFYLPVLLSLISWFSVHLSSYYSKTYSNQSLVPSHSSVAHKIVEYSKQTYEL